MNVYVESWAPEYGAPLEVDAALAPQPEEVDVGVERADWVPLDGAVEPPARVAFVDGVRRIDARLTVDHPELGPVHGVCGSCAAGSVVWEAAQPRAQIRDELVRRLLVVGQGLAVSLPLPAGLAYDSESSPAQDPAALVQQLQTRMRQLEGQLSMALAEAGYFVVADGPIQPLAPHAVVGYIKRQLAPYLPREQAAVVAELAPGQRTPLFRFGAHYPRYAWYLRLVALPRAHAWAAVVRCECTGTLSVDEARQLADRSAALLPRFASPLHTDPRAPQNLVPVGALEKHLRRLLGDAALVHRALRSAAGSLEVT